MLGACAWTAPLLLLPLLLLPPAPASFSAATGAAPLAVVVVAVWRKDGRTDVDGQHMCGTGEGRHTQAGRLCFDFEYMDSDAQHATTHAPSPSCPGGKPSISAFLSLMSCRGERVFGHGGGGGGGGGDGEGQAMVPSFNSTTA